MKSLAIIGGPLLLFTGIAFYLDFFTWPDEQPGIVHFSGVPLGGLFQLNTKVYQCDEGGNNCVLVEETTEFGEMADLEFETENIEYREGASKQYNKTKQPGLSKYTNIHLNSPSNFDFDYGEWKFVDRVDGSVDLLDGFEPADPFARELRQPEPRGTTPDENAMEGLELEPVELPVGE